MLLLHPGSVAKKRDEHVSLCVVCTSVCDSVHLLA